VIFSASEILPVAESTGFRADVIEKVLHLLNLLNMLNAHPFLKGKLALKGFASFSQRKISFERWFRIEPVCVQYSQAVG
jgi:hypothetical protein